MAKSLNFFVLNIDTFSDKSLLESILYHLVTENIRCNNFALGIPNNRIINTSEFGENPLPNFPAGKFDRLLVLVFEISVLNNLLAKHDEFVNIPATDIVK